MNFAYAKRLLLLALAYPLTSCCWLGLGLPLDKEELEQARELVDGGKKYATPESYIILRVSYLNERPLTDVPLTTLQQREVRAMLTRLKITYCRAQVFVAFGLRSYFCVYENEAAYRATPDAPLYVFNYDRHATNPSAKLVSWPRGLMPSLAPTLAEHERIREQRLNQR